MWSTMGTTAAAVRARVVALGACARLPAAAAEAEQIHALLVKYGVPRAASDVHARGRCSKECRTGRWSPGMSCWMRSGPPAVAGAATTLLRRGLQPSVLCAARPSTLPLAAVVSLHTVHPPRIED